MRRTRKPYDVEQVRHLGQTTIAYYDRFARAFWDGTRHHDVSQNYAAFLNAIESDPPYSILDLGCGPGRDLSHFRSLGHEAVGLDGSQQFVAMARVGIVKLSRFDRDGVQRGSASCGGGCAAPLRSRI